MSHALRGRAPACLISASVFAFSILLPAVKAADFVRGDANADGALDISDPIFILIYEFVGSVVPDCVDALDVDDSGRLDISDPIFLLNHLFRFGPPPAAPFPDPGCDATPDPFTCDSDCDDGVTSVVRTSPLAAERHVALTRETFVEFDAAIDPATVSSAALHATFGADDLTARLHVSADATRVTLFYAEPLPASARIRVTLAGSALLDAFGQAVDADGDGLPGGTTTFEFDTATVTPLAGTSAIGRVAASQPGETPEGAPIDVPLEGVTITVDGMEETLHAATDATGNFVLDPAPAGTIFVHINGRTASSGVPAGAYYPSVGKSWELEAGVENDIGTIYLPLIDDGTLQPVSEVVETVISFPPSVLAEFPEFAGVEVRVPPAGLFADDGTIGGMLGIAPVAPDRLPAPLPPDLAPAIVVTVQTDGASNFDEPVPVCFPNLPDSVTGALLAPGDKGTVWSFNHDTGEFDVVGPATVSSDGTLICSDAGFGLLAPGWHAPTRPRAQLDRPPKPPEEPKKPECPELDLSDAAALAKTALGCVSELTGVLATINAAVQAFDGLRTMGESIATITVNWQAGDLSIADAKTAVQGVQAGKNGVKAVVDRVTRQNPVSKAIDVADCAVSISSTAIDIVCRRKECFGSFVNSACSVAEPVKNLATTLRDSAKQLDGAIRNAPLTGVCIALDNVVTVIQNKELEQMQNGGAGGGVGDDEILAALQELRALTDAAVSDFEAAMELAAAAEGLQEQLTQIESATRVLLSAKGPFERGPYRMTVQSPESPPFEIRGEDFDTIRVGPLLSYTLEVLNLEIGSVGVSRGVTPSVGGRAFVAPFEIRSLDGEPDSDGDLLVDIAEGIVGTSPNDDDTDDDGIKDGMEVLQGTDPLEGTAARTGIVSAVSLQSPARDVCLVDDRILVATSFGLLIYETVRGIDPTVIGQVEIPDARAVACSGTHAGVVSTTALSVVDISNPGSTDVIHELDFLELGGIPNALVSSGPLAYVGCGHRVVTVDLASGTALGSTPLDPSDVFTILSLSGDSLVARGTETIALMQLGAGFPRVVGSFVPDERPTAIFNAFPVLYVGQPRGVDSFDISDPSDPTVLGQATGPGQFGPGALAFNGSRTLLSLAGNVADVDIWDASDPQNTDILLGNIDLPSIPTEMGIQNGLAYIGNATEIAIVNYLAFDLLGEPPTISLVAGSGLDLVAQTAFEGSAVGVVALVQDDVQVRSVDFYIDGTRAGSDGSFPFEHRFVTPRLADTESFTLRAMAVDSGGNGTWTDELTLTLVAASEFIPPTVTNVSPAEDSGDVTLVAAFFDESIDAATITDETFLLREAGLDTAFDTVDDVAVAPLVLEYRDELLGAFFTIDGELPRGLYRAELTTAVEDLAGNGLVQPFTWEFRASPSVFVTLTGSVRLPDDTIPPADSVVLRTGTLLEQNFLDAQGMFSIDAEVATVAPIQIATLARDADALLFATTQIDAPTEPGTIDLGTFVLQPTAEALGLIQVVSEKEAGVVDFDMAGFFLAGTLGSVERVLEFAEDEVLCSSSETDVSGFTVVTSTCGANVDVGAFLAEVVFLDAGRTLAASAVGASPVTLDAGIDEDGIVIPSGVFFFQGEQALADLGYGPGQEVSFGSSGGVDVGPLSASITLPPEPVVTEPDLDNIAATLDEPLVISWVPNAAADQMLVEVNSSAFFFASNTTEEVLLRTEVPDSDGTVVVPLNVLSLLLDPSKEGVSVRYQITLTRQSSAQVQVPLPALGGDATMVVNGESSATGGLDVPP